MNPKFSRISYSNEVVFDKTNNQTTKICPNCKKQIINIQGISRYRGSVFNHQSEFDVLIRNSGTCAQ